MSDSEAAARPRCTVVVPTYEEASNLPALVRRICGAVPGVEVIVVDDDSPDGTAACARELAKEHPVRLVERRGERGLATAVLCGLAAARAEVCVVMDADLSHEPEAIPGLLRAVEDGAHLAVGSRYVPGGEIDRWPFVRRLTSRAGTLLARPLTPIRDPLSGFFCLRRALLDGVRLKPRGFKILLEVLARARPARAVEVPIRFRDREGGASKLGARERNDYLRQVLSLYRDLDAWPVRLARYVAVAAAATAVSGAALHVLFRVLGGPRP